MAIGKFSLIFVGRGCWASPAKNFRSLTSVPGPSSNRRDRFHLRLPSLPAGRVKSFRPFLRQKCKHFVSGSRGRNPGTLSLSPSPKTNSHSLVPLSVLRHLWPFVVVGLVHRLAPDIFISSREPRSHRAIRGPSPIPADYHFVLYRSPTESVVVFQSSH
jgi:hypothetical protein